MTTLTNRETGEVIDLRDVERLVARYRSAPGDHLKHTIANQLMVHGTTLGRIKADLMKRIDVGMTMLDRAYDEVNQRRWDGWLVEYETVCDVLSQIEAGVLQGRWDLVTQRRTESEVA